MALLGPPALFGGAAATAGFDAEGDDSSGLGGGAALLTVRLWAPAPADLTGPLLIAAVAAPAAICLRMAGSSFDSKAWPRAGQ